MKINRGALKLAGYGYLLVPLLIFLFGWLRLPIALMCAVLVLVAFYSICKEETGYRGASAAISRGLVLFVILVAFLWVFMSGIGGFVYQRYDWHARNAVLHDLINYRWPVIFESGEGLVYYHCYFLLSALVGKLFGFGAANAALYI